MKKYQFIITVLITTLMLFSCASKQKIQRERNENFIADIEPFTIGEMHLYTRMTINSPKISDFELVFTPRTNNISVSSKLGLDVIKVNFSYKERQLVKTVAEQYIELYNNNDIKDDKSNNKNALLKSEIPLSWGVFGFTHSIKVKYQIHIEYLEPKKPYLRLKFEPTTDPKDDSTTPAFSIYVSPSQWQTIFDMCSQESLEAQCDEIIEQAEAF